jgi:N-methylhydantoinase B
LAWDIVWNEGVTRPVRLIAPEGSCVNCVRPAPISLATVGNVQIVNNLASFVIGKMLGASEKYKHRAMAVWRGSHAGMHVFGRNSRHEPFVGFITDSFAGAAGARSFGDGVDVGGEIPNVVSRCANVEQHELYLPLLYLYRRMVPDSGGPGEWRGGLCHEYAFRPHDAAQFNGATFGKAMHSPMAYGLFGGYPGCHVAYHVFRDANVDELPYSLETTSGAVREDRPWGEFPIGDGDVMYIRNIGSGGYADPLERDPEAVLGDVLLGAVGVEAARRIYGVVVDAHAERVDQDATTAERARIRAERLGGRPATGARREVPLTGKSLTTYLQGAGDSSQCTRCGASVAGSDQRWKEVAPSRQLPTSAAGPDRDGGGRYFLRQYYCPECATVLETEALPPCPRSRRGSPDRNGGCRCWPGHCPPARRFPRPRWTPPS